MPTRHNRRVAFLGYGDPSPYGPPGKSKEIFYITKGLYENNLLARSLVRDFKKKSVGDLRNVLIRPIPFGNFIPKAIGAINKLLRIRINNMYYSEILFSLCAKPWLMKNKDQYDIVLGSGRPTGSFELVKKMGKTIVLYSGGEHPLSFIDKYEKENKKWGFQKKPRYWNREWLLGEFGRCIELADYIVVLSSESKKSYIKYGFSESKIYLCPLGVDGDVDNQESQQPGLGEKGTFNVVFMGRVNVLKGVQYLLEAWGKANLPDNAILHVCGGHPRGADEIIGRFKGLKNVYYPGFVNAKKYFQKADVFVLPTLSEGFGKSVLEGMAFGLPGIVTPIASEPIVHGENGFIVPYRDSDGIAHWLKKLYEEREMRYRVGLEARESVRKYTWKRFSDSVARSIEDIVSRVGH